MKDANSKPHPLRKNGHMAELHRKRRQERNQQRPKQQWVGGESVREGGHWERPWQESNSVIGRVFVP